MCVLLTAHCRDDARAVAPGHTPAPQTPLRQGRGRGNLPSPETLTPCEGFGHSAPGISRPIPLPALWCGCVSGYCAVAHRPRIAGKEFFRLTSHVSRVFLRSSFPKGSVGNPGTVFHKKRGCLSFPQARDKAGKNKKHYARSVPLPLAVGRSTSPRRVLVPALPGERSSVYSRVGYWYDIPTRKIKY